MGRYSKYPMTYNQLHQLKICDLKRFGFFRDDTVNVDPQIITWRNKMSKEILAQIIISKENNRLLLRYNCNNNLQRYIIELKVKKSNLGKGYYHYFICPITKNPARILFLYDNVFRSLKDCRGVYYNGQLESKKWREYTKKFSVLFSEESLFMEMNKKNMKKKYNKSTTRKYQSLLDKYTYCLNKSNWDLTDLLIT